MDIAENRQSWLYVIFGAHKSRQIFLNDACTLDDARNGNFKLHTLMDMFAGYTQIAYEPIQDVFNGKKIKLQCDADEVMITHNQEIVAVYQRVENDVYRCARGLW